jgi:hypothetical protein
LSSSTGKQPPLPSPSDDTNYQTSLANFFQNFGPNTTTFIVPGEAFPTRYRSTAHGIAAASGKLGAIIAQVGFAQLRDRGGPNMFIKHILQIFALFMLTGLFATLLIPETKGRTLEGKLFVADTPAHVVTFFMFRALQRVSGRLYLWWCWSS